MRGTDLLVGAARIAAACSAGFQPTGWGLAPTRTLRFEKKSHAPQAHHPG